MTVIYEGPVLRATSDALTLGTTCPQAHFWFNDEGTHTFEVIEKAKRKWRHGDIARYKGLAGEVNLRFWRSDGWYDIRGEWQTDHGSYVETHCYEPVIRGGKLVA